MTRRCTKKNEDACKIKEKCGILTKGRNNGESQNKQQTAFRTCGTRQDKLPAGSRKKKSDA